MTQRFLICIALIAALALMSIGLFSSPAARPGLASSAASVTAGIVRPYPGYTGG